MHRAWQGTVFSIAVNLSALPYLLRMLPGPTPSRRPDQSFPVGPDRVGREREASKGLAYPRSEEQGRSQTAVPPQPGLPVGAPPGLLAGGVGRGPDHGLGLSLDI